MKSEEYSPADIEALVLKAQNGDQDSFATLFDVWFDRVYRYTAYRVDAAECEDIVSEIFLKLVQYLPQYKSRSGIGFGAWLFRMAHNTIIDWYRKKKALLGSDIETDEEDFFSKVVDEQPLPNQQVNSLYDYERVYRFLKKLKPDHREVLELKFLEGFNNKEISAITGKSEGNIRITQLRALKEMREFMKDDEA
ncbi:sigma-70 family RNA polymerase sigma factor [bacterium]|nr:sigma-70 family RNA polymerase sigma factor [bacterium]NCQ55250.1 sigma-70 family RNA polymerase sigma factor [Candidatus Parcubacteria bacterium]NCS67237.1 sigma-70 family RNA polymerase sigma factor [Candidatus Peregrinibacteria bacterium]NCS96492.1 sigma-70 family RNA polymerase sigma factor [bacterium]